MAGDLLTGLRIGALILWSWLWWRLAFESWQITKQPEAVRAHGWKHFRRSLFVMAFAIVVFFSPENLLRVHGHISEQTGFYMLAGGVALLCLSGSLVLHGLDIATNTKARVWPVYAAIVAVSVIYGITA